MKFVGRPQGKLMKGAPGNYVQNQIYRIPFRHSKFDFWELVEKTPELVVPEMVLEESVFESVPEEVVVEESSFEEPFFIAEPEVETTEEKEEEKAKPAESPATVTYRGRQLFMEDEKPKVVESPEEAVESEIPLEDIDEEVVEEVPENIDTTSVEDDDVSITIAKVPEPDISVTLEILNKSTMAQLRAFIKSQGADPNPTGKKGYISRAELLEVARSLLPDES